MLWWYDVKGGSTVGCRSSAPFLIDAERTTLMLTWLLYLLIVLAALVMLLMIAYALPWARPVVFFTGSPVVVLGASLGAKFVKETRRPRRTRQH
jgi:membrane protein implicated in regulation of membrane protease activity